MVTITVFNEKGMREATATSTQQSYAGILREWERGKLKDGKTGVPIAMRHHSRRTLLVEIHSERRIFFGNRCPGRLGPPPEAGSAEMWLNKVEADLCELVDTLEVCRNTVQRMSLEVRSTPLP